LRVIVDGGIGDVILATPALREWKRQNPSGRLIVEYQSRAQREVLRGNPYIGALRRPGLLRRWLRDLVPDLVLRMESDVVRLSRLQAFPATLGHASVLLAEMMGNALGDRRPQIYLTERESAEGRSRLARLARPVVIHCASRADANVHWPADNWARLVTECPQYEFVQIGASHEPVVAGAVDFRGLALRESFAVLKASCAFVGIDSGPAQAAVALGVPAIVLFGPSQPEASGHEAATNLYARRRCSPCTQQLAGDRCPYDQACMRAITVESVKAALQRKTSALASIPARAREEMELRH
jgi:ADP-heptose:LPS heptosyltransferase